MGYFCEIKAKRAKSLPLSKVFQKIDEWIVKLEEHYAREHAELAAKDEDSSTSDGKIGSE